MWMRRRPPARGGRGSGKQAGYAPVYADSGALRAIAAGLSADAAAALAAVAPDIMSAVPVAPYTMVPVSPFSSAPAMRAPVPTSLVRLGFSDDSEFDIDAANPWGRALLAIATDLLAARPSRLTPS